MTKRRPESRKVLLPAGDQVTIVNDAMIARPVADGRQLPLVILDTSARPDIDEMIRVHEHVVSGEARSAWAVSKADPDAVVLMLDFDRPIELRIVLRFGIEQRGGLVDLALAAGAIYLQAGRPGDRLIHDINRTKILVDLPDTGFGTVWDELLLRRMTTVFSRRMGATPRKARPLAGEVIAEWRRLGSFRMPTPDDDTFDVP